MPKHQGSFPPSAEKLEQVLRLRVGMILDSAPRSKTDDRKGLIRNTLGELRDSGSSVYIFGGMLRDLLAGLTPRDVDLVVGDDVASDLDAQLSRWRPRRNRYGGLNFKNDGWEFDLWALGKTWAFHNYPVGSVLETSFSALPQTTFLNVEAVAMQLWPSDHSKSRNVFEHGFFSAFRTKTVEINYELNPAPEYCVVRSLLVAQKLSFKLGPRLVKYIAKHANKYTIQEFARLQGRHYGKPVIVEYNMNKWLELIHEHAESTKRTSLNLVVPEQRQLSLFKNYQLSLWPATDGE